jgi:hypothetical protein
MIRMSNEIKEGMYKHPNDFKENANNNWMNSKRIQINSWIKWVRQCRIWKRDSIKVEKSLKTSNWNPEKLKSQ